MYSSYVIKLSFGKYLHHQPRMVNACLDYLLLSSKLSGREPADDQALLLYTPQITKVNA